MKKTGIIAFVLALMLSMIPVQAASQPDITANNSCRTLDSQLPYLGSNQLVSNTTAAVLYETGTETLMYAHNADQQVEPASLLKILTALIAVEKGKMDDVVTVRAETLDSLPSDAAVVELVADEVVTVRDLIYCMMVGSGNDAAAVLAEHVMGSQDAFVAEMNRYANELGCLNTSITNVHGLYDQEQFTTARDIAKILSKAIQNEQFRQVFGAKYYDMPKTNKSEARFLGTQNYLLNNDKVVIYFDERVNGGRTAINSDRSRSIASTAQANGMEMVCVVIGSKSQYEKDGYTEKVFGGYNETKELLNLGLGGHKPAQILYANQVLQQSNVLNGNCDVSIGVKNDILSIVPDNVNLGGLTFRYFDEVDLIAPITKGQKMSTLQIWNGTICIAETETYAMNDVNVVGTEFDDVSVHNNGPRVIILILCVLVGCTILVVAFLYVRRKMLNQQHRHERNRRRSG